MKEREHKKNQDITVEREGAHQEQGSLHVQPLWLLVASSVRSAAMLLMQFPDYQYTGTHFADLGRMTG